MLKGIAGVTETTPINEMNEKKIRQEMANKLTAGLLHLLDEDSHTTVSDLATQITESPDDSSNITNQDAVGEYLAPWIDTEDCTACGDCMKMNSDIFAYNENKKAIIKNPDGGPYRDLVKAAEKCTAQIIHPGLPRNRSEKDIDKWISRGEKYNEM